MIHRSFLACLLVCIALPVWSQEFEDSTALVNKAQSFLETSLAKEYVGIEPEHIQVTVSHLDPRIHLDLCDGEITQVIGSPRPYRSNLSVKMQCNGSKPWTIYIPAKIDTLANIAVLSKSLKRGDIITQDDVELTLMNTAQAGYGYISDLNRVVGMELKRRLQVGSAVRTSHLKAPEVVSKGDKVLLEASMTGISVVTNAKALTAGRLGDQIQVMNTKSNRVVDAEVVAPGRVKVSL